MRTPLAARILAVAAVLTAAACASGAPEEGGEQAPVVAAAGVEHVAILRDGGAAHGRIAGGEVRIRSAYGDLAFPADEVVRVHPSTAGVGRDVVVTTEGDRVVGAVDWESFTLRTAGGDVAVRPGEVTDVRIGAVPDFGDAVVRVRLMPNEDLLVSDLPALPSASRRLLSVALRAGPGFDVPVAASGVEFAEVRRVRLRGSSVIGYESERTRTGARRLTEIHRGSPADRAGWRVGDVVASLDGKAITVGNEVIRRRDAILRGDAVYAVLGLVRGDARLTFLLER